MLKVLHDFAANMEILAVFHKAAFTIGAVESAHGAQLDVFDALPRGGGGYHRDVNLCGSGKLRIFLLDPFGCGGALANVRRR